MAATTTPLAPTDIAAEIERLREENRRLLRNLSRGPQMTAADALFFEVKRDINIEMAAALLPCDCKPYEDIFTVRRWNALGYHVLKGEHACMRSGKREQFPLFCRCQTNAPAKSYSDGVSEELDAIPF